MKTKANLAVVFLSVLVKSKGKSRQFRIKQYAQAISQLSKWLTDCDIILVENTGFMDQYPRTNPLHECMVKHNILSLPANTGLRNKGLGELEMFAAASEALPFENWKNILYITGRQFHITPYAIEKALNIESGLLVSNPSFTFVDGNTFQPGTQNQWNDMFFAGDSSTMNSYLEHYKKNAFRLEKLGLSSEELLWDFTTQENIRIQVLPALGLLRSQGKNPRRLSDWHVI